MVDGLYAASASAVRYAATVVGAAGSARSGTGCAAHQARKWRRSAPYARQVESARAALA
jgi:hypothetical protein